MLQNVAMPHVGELLSGPRIGSCRHCEPGSNASDVFGMRDYRVFDRAPFPLCRRFGLAGVDQALALLKFANMIDLVIYEFKVCEMKMNRMRFFCNVHERPDLGSPQSGILADGIGPAFIAQ